ncbi:MAG: helix-turn-helix transcriptional regulator [Planctomycetales bacterium]|nr:helix-turn-helix transcriptional regulator [Planctomycetales bacterium]
MVCRTQQRFSPIAVLLRGHEALNHPNQPTLEQARPVFSLMHECCELGFDPKAWRTHLVEGMSQILDSEVAATGIGLMENGIPLTGPDLFVFYERKQGLTDGLVQANLVPNRTPPDAHPILNPLVIAALPPLPTVVKSFRRQELVDDEEWFQSPYYQRVHKPSGVDDVLSALFIAENGNCEFLSVMRSPGRPDYTSDEAAVFHLVAEELLRHIGDRLKHTEHGISFWDVPPQCRRVLLHLLRGLSEKQIAAELDVSRHTVHEHVKKIYIRYGVSSRGELHAIFTPQSVLKSVERSLESSGSGK